MKEIKNPAAPEALREALQSLRVGVCLVDSENWEVRFENARFFKWFPPTDEDGGVLEARLPEMDVERARKRLGDKRPFTYEVEVQLGQRKHPLGIEMRAEELGGEDLVVVEVRDLSKQRQAEYMLDSYSRMAEKHARDLAKEKERVEKLLLNLMPRPVYEEMKSFGTATPQRFDTASVLMLDFVGFTEMAVARDPSSTVAELNDIFTAFDRIVELFGCERIKTIGDAYLAVSGMPEAAPDHAANIAKVALRMRRYLNRRNESHPHKWLCRVGIGSGALIGSLIGVQKYVYDVFGPGVNLASRLEGLADPMQILTNEDMAFQLGDGFLLEERGEEEVRGFGTQVLYELKGERAGQT